MVTAEILKSSAEQEKALHEKEIETVEEETSKKLNAIKAQAEKQEKERSVEDMKARIEEAKDWVNAYIKVNGEPIKLEDIAVDEKNKMFKITFVAGLKDGEYTIPAYFKIIDALNNSYLAFQIPPGKKEAPADVLLEGKVYDVNVIKEKTKDADIRIEYNAQKTLAKILEQIDAFALKKDFEIAEDKALENTKITGLNNVQLGKEITKVEEGGYYRSVFLTENNEYRELGRVYFDAGGAVDPQKTKDAEFKILHVPLQVRFDLANNTFKIDNYEELAAKVLDHRKILKTMVENSSVGAYDVFTGLNRTGSRWEQTENLGLSLVHDSYILKRGKGKNDLLRFGFDSTDEPLIKDLKWDVVNSFILPVDAEGKNVYAITYEGSKLKIIESKEKTFQMVKELPELLNAPSSLKSKNNLYVYGKGLSYFAPDGTLVATIPSSKIENNEWRLETLSQDVDPYDIFKEYANQFSPELLKKLNIFENDVYAAFLYLYTHIFVENFYIPNLLGRPTVKVLEGNAYRYYTVHQNNEGTPFIFDKDSELYIGAQKAVDILKANLQALDALSKTQLKIISDKQEKDFLKFLLGGLGGFLDADTQAKLTFLKRSGDGHRILERKLVYARGLVNGATDFKSFNFDVSASDIKLDLPERVYDVTLKGEVVPIPAGAITFKGPNKYQVLWNGKQYKINKSAIDFKGDERYEVTIAGKKFNIGAENIDFKGRKKYDVSLEGKTFTITRDDVTLENKILDKTDIEGQKFQVTSEFKDGKLVLRFDTIQ